MRRVLYLFFFNMLAAQWQMPINLYILIPPNLLTPRVILLMSHINGVPGAIYISWSGIINEKKNMERTGVTQYGIQVGNKQPGYFPS